MFQASDTKGRHFFNLLDDDLHPIEPLYSKGGSWIEYFRYSNSLCSRAARAIVNYALIGEYCLCFFPNEDFSCSCVSRSLMVDFILFSLFTLFYFSFLFPF